MSSAWFGPAMAVVLEFITLILCVKLSPHKLTLIGTTESIWLVVSVAGVTVTPGGNAPPTGVIALEAAVPSLAQHGTVKSGRIATECL